MLLKRTDDKNYVGRRVFFVIFILILFIVLKVSLLVIESLKVVEFAFLLLIIGLAPAYLLKNTLDYDNIVSWFSNAAAISLVFIPLMFLLSGFLGINIVFSNPIPILYILATLSLAYVILFVNDSDFVTNLSVKSMSTFDKTAYILIFFFFSV